MGTPLAMNGGGASPGGGLALLMSLHKKSGGDEMSSSAPEDENDHDGDDYEIPVPDGFEPPDGAEPGRKFEVTVKMHLSDDGKMLCIDDIEGIPTGAEDKEDAQEPSEDTGEEGEGSEEGGSGGEDMEAEGGQGQNASGYADGGEMDPDEVSDDDYMAEQDRKPPKKPKSIRKRIMGESDSGKALKMAMRERMKGRRE